MLAGKLLNANASSCLTEANGISDMWFNVERWPDVSPYVSLCLKKYIHSHNLTANKTSVSISAGCLAT